MDTDPTSGGPDDALLQDIYAPEPFDSGLTAALLLRINLVHPEIDPEEALSRAVTVATAVAHLAGAAAFCRGIDALLRSGSYEIRVIVPSPEHRSN